jgi:hypothetical protein
MFPIAHAWLLTRVIPDASPAHFLGCVWPDMLFESPLSHPQSHRSGARLAEFAAALPAASDRELVRAFVAGVLTHGSEPRGFDWFSDEEWGGRPLEEKGYAFQHGRQISARSAEACGVPPEQGWWKAHNIVEIAFERTLYTADPALGSQLQAVCADGALIARIAVALSSFYGTPMDHLAHPMRRFQDVVQLHPADAAASARTYALQVRLKHPGAAPDDGAIAALIEDTERIIASDRDAYLAECVERVGEMLRPALA